MSSEMKSYRVKWEIDVVADSPLEAAIEAARVQEDQTSWAPQYTGVFDVEVGEEEWEQFDLEVETMKEED